MMVKPSNKQARQLLKLRHVMAMTCLARSTVYKYCTDNNFLRPIQLRERNVAWLESEVQEWIEQKMYQRGLAC